MHVSLLTLLSDGEEDCSSSLQSTVAFYFHSHSLSEVKVFLTAPLTSMNHRTHDLITLPLFVALVVSLTLCAAAPSSPASTTNASDPLDIESQDSGQNVSSQVETAQVSPAALARLEDHLIRVYPWVSFLLLSLHLSNSLVRMRVTFFLFRQHKAH